MTLRSSAELWARLDGVLSALGEPRWIVSMNSHTIEALADGQAGWYPLDVRSSPPQDLPEGAIGIYNNAVLLRDDSLDDGEMAFR